MTLRFLSMKAVTELATPIPPVRSAVSPTKVRKSLKRRMFCRIPGEGSLWSLIWKPVFGSSLASSLAGGQLFAPFALTR